MKINDQDIEKLAEVIHVILFSLGSNIPVSHIKIITKACEDKMVEEAADGFEDWADDYFDLPLDKLSPHFKEAFTAGALSQMKRNQNENK